MLISPNSRLGAKGQATFFGPWKGKLPFSLRAIRWRWQDWFPNVSAWFVPVRQTSWTRRPVWKTVCTLGQFRFACIGEVGLVNPRMRHA